MEYSNTNKGTLGKNKRKELDTHPDYSGQINVDGIDFWLSGWIKENKSTGEKFFSLSVKPKEANNSVSSDKPDVPRETMSDFDDEIPW